MENLKVSELQNGLRAAYIDGSVAANLAYKPGFVSNNPEEGKKVISSIEEELLRCEQFQISVAFITMGGVTPLLHTLKELEEKGIPGQILTTNYLNFSEPKALEKLNGLRTSHSKCMMWKLHRKVSILRVTFLKKKKFIELFWAAPT